MDVLACPHCDRMFHATPAILGKAIRCRQCRQTFRVPADPATAALGPEPEVPQPEILVAVECVVHGVDARRCPVCSRTFSMQPRFVGTRIRCRGCREPFIVLASTRPAPSPPAAVPRPAVIPTAARPAPAAGPSLPPPPPPRSAEPDPEVADDALPVIHEDGGDVLAVEPVGQPLVVAVRPRACWRSRLNVDPIRGPFRSGRFS